MNNEDQPGWEQMEETLKARWDAEQNQLKEDRGYQKWLEELVKDEKRIRQLREGDWE